MRFRIFCRRLAGYPLNVDDLSVALETTPCGAEMARRLSFGTAVSDEVTEWFPIRPRPVRAICPAESSGFRVSLVRQGPTLAFSSGAKQTNALFQRLRHRESGRRSCEKVLGGNYQRGVRFGELKRTSAIHLHVVKTTESASTGSLQSLSFGLESLGSAARPRFARRARKKGNCVR